MVNQQPSISKNEMKVQRLVSPQLFEAYIQVDGNGGLSINRDEDIVLSLW